MGARGATDDHWGPSGRAFSRGYGDAGQLPPDTDAFAAMERRDLDGLLGLLDELTGLAPVKAACTSSSTWCGRSRCAGLRACR